MSVIAPTGPPSNAQVLRLSVQNLACHPQAQRRYVQIGWMDRAVANFTQITENLSPLVAEGEINAEDVQLLQELRAAVIDTADRHPDFLQTNIRQPREFLFSKALEDEGWERIRTLARAAHGRLSGDRSVFISIMAK
jgi:hypothetical protein